MAKKENKKKDSSLKAGAILGAGIAAAVAGGLFLYGPHGKDNRKKIKTWTIKAKADVLDEIENMKEVTEDKYHGAVDKVIRKYSRLKNVSEAEAIKLGKELKRHWKTVAEEVNSKKKK